MRHGHEHPGALEGLGRSSPPARPAPGGAGDAEGAARRFAVAWWTYDWRDPPGARHHRVISLVTPALAATLGSGPGSPVLDQVARAEQRHVAVGAPAVTVSDRAGMDVGLAVTAPVTVTAEGAAPAAGRWAMEVLAVPYAGRWVIAGLNQ